MVFVQLLPHALEDIGIAETLEIVMSALPQCSAAAVNKIQENYHA